MIIQVFNLKPTKSLKSYFHFDQFSSLYFVGNSLSAEACLTGYILRKKRKKYLLKAMSRDHQTSIQDACVSHIRSPLLANTAHNEDHSSSGEYIKSAIYGGLDGLVALLTVIVGGLGSGNTPYKILSIGMAVLIGDAFGMGLGDYLSSKSEAEFVQSEYQRELWEVNNKLQDEKQEMEELYIAKGYSAVQARRLSELMSSNPEGFVNIMMLEELGLMAESGSPLMNGIVTLCSFVLFGFFPLLPYILYRLINFEGKYLPIVSLSLGGLFLFVLGFTKALLIKTGRIKSGLVSLLLGAGTTAIGFGIGVALNPGVESGFSLHTLKTY